MLKSAPQYVSNGGTASFYVAVARTESDPACPHEDAYTAFVLDKHWLGIDVGPRVSRGMNGEKDCHDKNDSDINDFCSYFCSYPGTEERPSLHGLPYHSVGERARARR